MYERSEIVSADKAKTDLIVPRSIFGSWLRTDDPNIIKLLLIIENWRIQVFEETDFLDVSGRTNILQSTTPVILGGINYVSSELEKRYRHGCYQNAPLKLSLTLEGFSKSCLLLKADLIDTFDDTVLGSMLSRMVLTNSATRRSVRVPRWFRDAFSEHNSGDVPMPVYAVQRLPRMTFSHAYRVREDDIDSFHHVNNKVYLRECLRCVDEAPLVGPLAALRDAHRDDWAQRITAADTFHARECLAGDDLVVHGWQQHPDLVQFQIRRQDDIVYHCNLRFSVDAIPQAKL